MDMQLELSKEHSKENSQIIADYIGHSPERYAALWNLIKTAEAPIPQRASWVLDHSSFSYSPAIQPFISDMILEIQKPVHVAVKRNVMKILAATPEIPEDLSASLFDTCINWIIEKKTAVAVKVYAIEVVAKIALPYKELREEVKVVLEDQLKHGSAGVKVRARRMIAIL